MQFRLDVWGDLACFTRPEAKVERFSYPIMNPSAARGVLDSIYCKYNEFGWQIDRIEVMKPIRFISLKRNEVKEKISYSSVIKALHGAEAPLIIADATKEMTGSNIYGRTQRQTMALCDVRYRITAHIKPRIGFESRLNDFEKQAERRIIRGKCFCQPFFGCREFPAFFAPAIDGAVPIKESMEIGYMVYDTFDLDAVIKDESKAFISLFWAELRQGVLEVPLWDSELVLKPV